VPLTVAGRTDAGVHAWGQVASYEGEAAPLGSLNALLPPTSTVTLRADGRRRLRRAPRLHLACLLLPGAGAAGPPRDRALARLHWNYPVDFEAAA
jgi:tRNA pseudouridine38-40 synthase